LRVKDEGRLRVATSACALALLLLAQCRRQDPPRADPTPPRAAARLAPEPVPSPPAAMSAAMDDTTDAGAPLPSKGAWLDGTSYRFRLDDVRPCAPSAGGGATRIGVAVRVTSNINELLVAPRDVKLQAGGVILDSAVAEKTSAGCAPLLAPRSLRAGKTADGVVVFDVPPGFNAEHRPVRLTYQPTRWGGARRVEAVLPPGAVPP
jgi:hypothetical protein